MHFNHTLSAILRGTWLIDPLWAQQHSVLAFKLLKGEDVDFGTTPKSDDHVAPIQLAARGYKVGRSTNLSNIPEGSVAIVDLIGPVVRYGGMCSYGLEDTASLVRQLNNAGNISAIVFNVNSPGGEASGTAMFASLVKSINKPTIGIVDDGMAASAAMWIISACDEVYATNAQSSFGSIGAYTVLADFFSYYEKEGLPIHEIYAPQSTDKNKDYRDALEGNYDGVKASLSELVDNFIGDVKTNRAGKLNLSAGDPFTGKMFNAKQAKKIGLIDGVKSMEQVISRANELAQAPKTSIQKSSTNTMSKDTKYPAVAAAAGWKNGYEVTEEGLHITHEDAAALETALTTGAEAVAALATLTTAAGVANQKITELTTALEASEKNVTTAKADADTQRALATKYGAQSSNTGTTVSTEKDALTEAPKQAAMDPVTAEAMKVYEKNRHKAVAK